MNNIERAKNCLKYLDGINPQLYHRGVSVDNAIPKNAMLFIRRADNPSAFATRSVGWGGNL